MEQSDELEKKVDTILAQSGLMIVQELTMKPSAKKSAEHTKMKMDCVIAKADPSKKDEVTRLAREQIDDKAKDMALDLKSKRTTKKRKFPNHNAAMPHPPKKLEPKRPTQP